MERMSWLDSMFLRLENDRQQMAVGAALTFDGPMPSYREVLEAVAGKLPAVPRYRQRVHTPPLGVGRPVWVDDPHFSLRYHVRHTALPAPGTQEQLLTTAGRIFSLRLDRDRPLWEMWLVEGLGDGGWALLSKTHHAMVDGVAGVDLAGLLLDPQPTPARPRVIPADDQPVGTDTDWAAEGSPSTLDVVRVTVQGSATDLAHGAVAFGRTLARPADAAKLVAGVAYGAARLGGRLASPHVSELTGPLSPHRRWAWARMSIREVKTVRQAFGGTLNDVVLTAVTGGFRALLQSRGIAVDGRVVRTMVPVNTRTEPDPAGPRNAVSALFVDLPVGEADPVACLEDLTRTLQAAKTSGMAEVITGAFALADVPPPALLDAATTWIGQYGWQDRVSTVTTNVPGPRIPLYFAGCRLQEMFPYIPLGMSVRIIIGIMSYDGRLALGITGDLDAAPDVDVLARGVEDTMAALIAAAQDRRTE